MTKKLIGVYGGTFDPIHNGHLNLAIEIMEKKGLDEVWFCPAKTSPHKQEMQTSADAHQRAHMITLAIKDEPRFKMLDLEISREGPSYTVDTLKELTQKEKNKKNPAQLFLILGEDSIPGFFHWHQPEEIVHLTPLLIGSRYADFKLDNLNGNPILIKAIKEGLVQTRRMDISATDVRKRLNNGLYCGHLVPKEVLDYINKNQLYLFSSV